MISTVYIAFSQYELDLQFSMIRHFLTHPDAEAAREAFLVQEVRAEDEAFKKYLSAKPDRDVVDEYAAHAFPEAQRKWLGANFHHIKDFSENRLKQVELILRYAVFEGFFLKTIANILWHYPDRMEHKIHSRIESLRKYMKRPIGKATKDRIGRTRATVKEVDHLHFAEWPADKTAPKKPYVWQYLEECLVLKFGPRTYCKVLERARRIRNHIVHVSFDLVIPDERMHEICRHLRGFPILLVEAAAKLYPDACTTEPPEEGDDGTPIYEILDELLKDG